MNLAIERAAIELLEEVLDHPPETRTQLLDSRCQRGEPLRERVEEMLRGATDDDRSFPVLRLGSEREAEPQGKPASEAPGVAFRPGDRVGSYTILSTLGEGGMGIVYLAEQDAPRRKVALKVLRPSFQRDADFLRRFEHEVELLGHLEHPGIARIYEAGRTSGELGVPYLAMEYVDGAPLCEFAARELTTIDQKVEFLARIADAVHFAHLKGIVHRDLKPGNVLVDALGQPKVLDFGIATSTAADVDPEQRGEAGGVFGTLAYMSPEQARCDAEAIDARSDVYSLGLIAYELLAGEAAFQAPRSPLSAALGMLNRGEPALLRTLHPELPRDVETIIATACREAPSARYQSASAFADDLRRCLARQPIAARPTTAFYGLSMFVRRNRALSVAIGAVLLVSVAGGVSFVRGELQSAKHAREQLDRRAAQTRYLADKKREADEAVLEQVSSGYENVRAQYRERGVLLPADLWKLNTQGKVYDDARKDIWENVVKGHIEFNRELFAKEPEELAFVLQSAADTLCTFGARDRALDLQTEALALRRETPGVPDEAMLESVAGTVELWMNGGSQDPDLCDLARSELDWAIEIANRELSKDDPLTLRLLNDLAAVLKRQKNLRAALAMNRDVHLRRQARLGPDHRQTLNSALNLAQNCLMMARAYRKQERGDEAYRLEEEAVELARDAFERATLESTDGEPMLLAALNAYCLTLEWTDRHSEATEGWEDLIFETTMHFGPLDPRTLTARHNLARNWYNQDRFNEALLQFEDVALERAEALGDREPRILASWKGVVDCERKLGLVDDALGHYRRAYDRNRAELGRTDRKTLSAMAQLALAQQEEGRDAESQALLGEYSRLERDHPEIATDFHERFKALGAN